jgi:hypothetical protein
LGANGLGNNAANLGGGAGAGRTSGDSGVIIFRFPSNKRDATVTGSPTRTVSGDSIIYQFTGSGTIRW